MKNVFHTMAPSIGMVLLLLDSSMALASRVDYTHTGLTPMSVHDTLPEYGRGRHYHRHGYGYNRKLDRYEKEIDKGIELEPGTVYQKVEVFRNKTYFTDMFRIDTAGTYRAILTDLGFPGPLQDFGMSITSATESLGSLLDSGSFTFAADPGNYFVSFFGNTVAGWGSWGKKLGQYGIEVILDDAVKPVPAPGALFLFGSGLLGLVAAVRRKNAL